MTPPDTVYGDWLGLAPDARNVVLDDGTLRGTAFHGSHAVVAGQADITVDSFRSSAINSTASSATWILAAVYGTNLVMVELRVSVTTGTPANNPNNNIAYVCGVASGYASIAANTMITSAVVNAAWSQKTVLLYSNSTTNPDIGVRILDYSIMLTVLSQCYYYFY